MTAMHPKSALSQDVYSASVSDPEQRLCEFVLLSYSGISQRGIGYLPKDVTMKTTIRLITVGLILSGPVQASEIGADVFKARRAALMESLDGGVAVMFGTGGSKAIVKTGFVQES